MIKETDPENKAPNESIEKAGPEPGPISKLLSHHGLEHIPCEADKIGVEIIELKPDFLVPIVSLLKSDGFNYLQCQGGYDEGPGRSLVCFYHLIEIKDLQKKESPREIRLKIFLDRNGDLKVPSLYKLYRGSDWQERETYDMFGINFEDHPHPKRLLMPEDWKGWPLRKDYVQPDFYEMQDAY